MDLDSIDRTPGSRTVDDLSVNHTGSSHRANRSKRSFPRFGQLPAEIRLLIWNAAIDEESQRPRVVNILIKAKAWDRSHPPRLHVINKSWLQTYGRAGNLLATNREARAAAEAFLRSPPRVPARKLAFAIAGNAKTCRFGRALAKPLIELEPDPTRDILFLNGLDTHTAAPVPPEGEPSHSMPLPRGLETLAHIVPVWGRLHTFRLSMIELYALCQFRTVVMPIQGLVEAPEPGEARPGVSRISFARTPSPRALSHEGTGQVRKTTGCSLFWSTSTAAATCEWTTSSFCRTMSSQESGERRGRTWRAATRRARFTETWWS